MVSTVSNNGHADWHNTGPIIVHAINPLRPFENTDPVELPKPVSVRQYLDNNGIVEFTCPTLCLVNGEAIMRDRWSTLVLVQDDVCLFITLPAGGGGGGGGGGSNAIKTVLAIAVLVVATVVSGGVAGFVGGGMLGSFAGAAAAAAITVGGTALVNALVPAPGTGGGSAVNNVNALSASPTYSLTAQGNTARFGGAIPSQYGRHVMYPDFIAAPYGVFENNEQHLYQAMCLGLGEYDIEKIRIASTDINEFEEVTHQIVPPGATATLFDINVVTAEEVAGQQAPGTNEQTGIQYLGPFIAAPVDTITSSIGIDVIMPRGLYYADDNGNLQSRSVSFVVEARPIDEDDLPVGSWIVLGSESKSAASATAIRESYTYTVTPDRYQVRFRRTSDFDTSSRAGNDLVWGGLKSWIEGPDSFDDVTLLLVKARATNNLSTRTSRRFNVIQTRKLPIWDDQAGSWSAPVATRSIAWAFADICRSNHGGGLSDHKLALSELSSLDVELEARGDHFDAVFDSGRTIWQALTDVARCGRAVPVQQGSIMRMVRDKQLSLPSAFFGPRNILRNSFSIEYMLANEETSDNVEVTYFDERTWKPRQVEQSLAGSAMEKTAKVNLFGCTDKSHASREGHYMCAANQYRRIFATFRTELEGLVVSYGSLVMVSHDVPSWGTGGDVIAWDIATKTLTLSEPLELAGPDVHYIGFRDVMGGIGDVVAVDHLIDPTHAVLVDVPVIPIYTGTEMERTHFSFGPGNNWAQPCRVLSVRPRDGTTSVEISVVVENDLVHVN